MRWPWYDARGNRKALIDQDGGRFTYSYDAVSRITQVINPQGDRTSYSYDAAGRRTVKKLANGTRASFSYDNVGNLTRLANLKSDGTTISSFNYKYDEVGNRTSVVEADGSRVTWSYDDTYQLTGEHRTGSHAYRNTFAYDPAGNRTLKNEDGARTTYSYDGANQLKTAVDTSGTTTYTFDEDGNQERVLAPNGDRTTTSWDFENRTMLVQLPSGIRNTMAYEPGGLRVKLEESTGTKKFVWDEQNYLAETDENDDTQVVYTNEPRLYGNLVSQRRGTESHWYQFDAIGSTRELTDGLQTVSDTRLYDAWGNTVASTGTIFSPFRYVGITGYYHDRDTSSYSLRSRRYTPRIARFLSRDPLLVRHISSYAYGDNAPITYIDPSGMIEVKCISEEPAEKCGDPWKAKWLYSLDNPAPCNGYFVQMIEAWCIATPCIDCALCVDDLPEAPDYRFLEAWEVKKGALSQVGVDTGETDYTDSTGPFVTDGTCGVQIRRGTVKFYCEDANDVPVLPPIGAADSVGTGPLKREWSRVPVLFGKDFSQPCWTTTSLPHLPLPDNTDPPDWWKRNPIEGPAHRSILLVWYCCDDDDYAFGTVHPECDSGK